MKYRSTIIAAAAALLAPLALHAAEKAAQPNKDAKPVAAAEAKAEQAQAKPDESKAKCTYVTGSRIRHDPPVDCDQSTSNLRTYTAEDLQNTGQIDIGDALRWLDPRFQ
jgi:Ni/Co efflux regulator RcnB